MEEEHKRVMRNQLLPRKVCVYYWMLLWPTKHLLLGNSQ